MCLVIHEPVNCITAEEFLNKISPMGDYFKKENLNSPWLFRGQGQDWPLIPSLFRKNAINVKLLTSRNVEGEYSELLRAERDIILDFFSIADKHGLIISDDSQELRSMLESVRATNDGRVVHTGVDFRLSLRFCRLYLLLSIIMFQQDFWIGLYTHLLRLFLQQREDLKDMIKKPVLNIQVFLWLFGLFIFPRLV
jgi:hypothetical protein